MSRSRSILLALALAIALGLALLAAWFLLGESADSSSVERSTTEESDARSTSRSLLTGGPGALDAGLGGAGRTSDAGLGGEPVRLAAARVRVDPGAAVGTLSGRVVALGSQRGVAGATLTFAHLDRTTSVISGPGGAFVLQPRELGTYGLAIASAEGFLPFAPEWGSSPIRFEARPGAHVEGIVVTLVEARPLRVEVSSADGARVAGARVVVLGAGSGEHALVPLAADHVTDASGVAEVVAPDGAVLEASHADLGRGRGVVGTRARVAGHLAITLSTEPRAGLVDDQTIAGHVVDGAGRGIAEARVTAVSLSMSRSADGSLHPPLATSSGPDGAFTLEGADRGRYRLLAEHEGHATAVAQHVAAGATDVVLELEAEARLRVHLVDASTGEPIPAATIIVERATGLLTRERLALASSYDAAGTTELGGLPPGACSIVASAPGYVRETPTEAVLRAGATVEVELRLGHGGSIRGRVVSADGTPLASARASLEDRLGEGASAVPLEASAVTDQEGRFTLDGMSDGPRSVVFWADGHHGLVRSGLAVTPGETTDVGDVQLTPLAQGESPNLELAGIGVSLFAGGDAIRIGHVVPGGGAAEAGLLPGDAILAVDGTPVTALGFEGTIEHIRGAEGTSVVLRVGRPRVEVTDVVVVRRRVRG